MTRASAPGPLALLALAAALALPAASHAGKPKTLQLKTDKETRALAKSMDHITMGLVGHCIQTLPPKEQRKQAAVQTCVCRTAKGIEKDLAVVDGITRRHPKWKHAILHFKIDATTYDMTLAKLGMLRRMLKKCGH